MALPDIASETGQADAAQQAAVQETPPKYDPRYIQRVLEGNGDFPDTLRYGKVTHGLPLSGAAGAEPLPQSVD